MLFVSVVVSIAVIRRRYFRSGLRRSSYLIEKAGGKNTSFVVSRPYPFTCGDRATGTF